jgi:hypothetical protein
MRSVLTALAAGLFLVLVGAGCGGIDENKLESAIKSQTNEQLERAGRPESVSSVSCSKTRDAYHFTCDLLRVDGSTLLTVRANCTKDGTCRWRRA